LPLIVGYAFAKVKPRKLKRLYDRREAMYESLSKAYASHLKSGDVTGMASRKPSKTSKHPHK
jgi:hypothetical protein